MIVKASTTGILAHARRAASSGPPPVHLWNPPFCGDIDMRIARDGTWFHEGTPIGRPALVRLFASILRKEGESYFLVTPVEKVRLQVEDVPFIAVDVDVEEAGGAGQRLRFLTNVGDAVIAGAENPLRVEFDAESGEPRPYVEVRAGLEARIDRKSFYRLVDAAREEVHEGRPWLGLRSGGSFFPLLPAAALGAERCDAD